MWILDTLVEMVTFIFREANTWIKSSWLYWAVKPNTQ